MTPLQNRGVWAASAFVVALSFAAYLHFRVQPAPTGIHIEAAPASEIRSIGKEYIKPVAIKVYKHIAKKKLNLPASVQADSNKHVVTASTTPNDERQHTITTVVDSVTGETIAYDRVNPLPWISVETKSGVGVYAGIKNGESALRVEGHQELLQIKAVRLGLTASIDATQSGRTDTFIGFGASVRW